MKNIVVIITDTFRYDNLRNLAERPIRTPELDKFADERATSVEKFYMGSFPTIPHRTDFATGVLGWPHYGWQPIDVSGPNHIAKLIGQAGYATQLIVDCPHLFNSRFQHDFDAAFQHRGQEGDKPLLHLNDPIKTVTPTRKTRTQPMFRGHPLVDTHRWTNRYYRREADTFSAKTSATTIQWLEENSQSDPFFLWVDFFDPHEPWDPPEYLVRRYHRHYDGPPMMHPNYGPSSAYTTEELQNLWAHYAAESELVDRAIGRILQKINDLEIWDNTIVVVMSDHGMSIGEHGRTGKSNITAEDIRYWPIYPEIGHAILMVAGGEIPSGNRLEAIVQPIDLLPTLCDLANLEINPPKPFDGISFAENLLQGKGKHRDHAVSGCNLKSPDSTPPRRSTTPFLVTDQWGYAPVGVHGKPELYELGVDPLATDDIADQNELIVNELHSLFISHLMQYQASEEFLSFWQKSPDNQVAGGSWAIDYPEDNS